MIEIITEPLTIEQIKLRCDKNNRMTVHLLVHSEKLVELAGYEAFYDFIDRSVYPASYLQDFQWKSVGYFGDQTIIRVSADVSAVLEGETGEEDELPVNGNEVEADTEEPADVLIVSTAHITEKADRWLHGQAYLMVHDQMKACADVAESTYGYWLYAHDEYNSNYPQSLCKLFDFAKKQGYSYIKLDRDGPKYSGLDVYDW